MDKINYEIHHSYIVYKMNVVVTRSPFEAAKSEVDVSEAIYM